MNSDNLIVKKNGGLISVRLNTRLRDVHIPHRELFKNRSTLCVNIILQMLPEEI